MASKPNVIIIFADDLGYGDLGCYGSKINETPTLDKMADEGKKFSNFYVSSPVCSPSRASLMTGCYPQRISFGTFDGLRVLFPGQGIGLSNEEKTVAKTFKESGYSTKIIGKWHCGDQEEFLPTNHGFDSYFGIPYSNDMGRQVKIKDYIPNDSSLHKITEWDRPPLPLVRDKEVIQEQPDQRSIAERYTEDAVKFMRENKETPFFLYLAHMQVHLPLYAAEKFVKESKNGDYGACVASIDWSTKVIFDELKELGIDENTIVIFTSDNGSRLQNQGGSNGNLRGGKGQTWDGGQRVPCIIRWPGKINEGQQTDALSTTMDFLPSITKLIGGNLPSKKIDGIEMSDLFFSNENSSKRDSFLYYNEDELEAIRYKNWKLHFKKEDKLINELYDLDNDISEKVNLYSSHKEIVSKLSILADEFRKSLGDKYLDIKGEEVRPANRIDNPKPLTEYDENHPYMYAEYDKGERG
ncbi:MAG: sulfatase [SAR202 cluster bacterium]|jgi:arylsulfatase A|nr:sulfatase [Chloroflexota bacterium]MQG19969.1 sulfatase [SAR202 cluster bacterium]MEC9099475.1 sulfatase [Chloroflexota bacterium]MED5237287.1 sulfatase [Chloroflexota bacterium]MQG24262.1 sulfatase [SAR202 cluster bacterium]|tara:strand:+ start:1277 stop:2680 length:1404 start_codon:yes stop_codon:yes gene_type:complete